MSNIYIFWVFNIFFLATQLHTYGLFHIGSNIKDKAISFNFYLSSRVSTSPLYEWERYFPCSGKMFCLSACTHKNSYSQNEPNYLAMNRKSEFELVFGRKWIFWHCNFSLSTRKLLKNLNPEFPHSWNNCHVLFLRFQRHWCGSALNLSSQEPDPVFNDRGWFCAFASLQLMHIGCCSRNVIRGNVEGGHCTLFSDSCVLSYLLPTSWWLVRSRSGLPEQCSFIRELLCLES